MKNLIITIAAVVLVGCSTKHTSLENIFEAIERGNIEIVKWHLAAGVDVNVKDGIGITPLHDACSEGHKEIVELLISKGAVLNAKDQDGKTPLDKAEHQERTKIADLLRKHGGKTGEELKAAEQVSKAEATDISIHNAVIEGDIQAINQSLEASMDINAKDEKGWAPMHLVAIDGNKVIAELLLKSGANVNERTDFGWTPLHLADNKIIAQLLITKGANLNAKNDGGETPLDWAIKRKDIATTDLLRKHGGKTGAELRAAGN